MPTACVPETLPLERRGRDDDSRPVRPENTRYYFVGDCNVMAVEARTRHEQPPFIVLLLHGRAGTPLCITCTVTAGADRSIVPRRVGSHSPCAPTRNTFAPHGYTNQHDHSAEAAAVGSNLHQGFAAAHRRRQWRAQRGCGRNPSARPLSMK